jgi:tellurite resistance protein
MATAHHAKMPRKFVAPKVRLPPVAHIFSGATMPVMVGCPTCSRTIAIDAAECPYCGAKFATPTQRQSLHEGVPARNRRRFDVVPLSERGVLSRLFKRLPRANAFIELRNMFAGTPWHEVRESDVATVLARYKLTSHDAKRELSAIYRDAVTFVAQDHAISATERAGLNRMKACFDLAEPDALSIWQEVARDLYRETLVGALSDGKITAREREALDRIATNLEMLPILAERIYAEEAKKAIELYFNHAISDGRYSPDEERRLKQMGEALGVSLTFDEKTQRLVERLRLLGQIDAGHLPTVAAPIMLTKGEVCHFAAGTISQREIRTVTRRVNYSGVSSSVRVIGNVRWRVGSISTQRVTQDVMTEVDRGNVYITSKKLLIQGARKKTSVSLGKIIHFTVFTDGLQIQKETGKDIWVVGDADCQIAGACLEAAARKVR